MRDAREEMSAADIAKRQALFDNMLLGDWEWKTWGDQLVLVSGRDHVVLRGGTAKGDSGMVNGYLPGLDTRSTDGRSIALTADHPLAVLLAGLPELIDVARDIEARDDRPNYLPRLRDALERAGLSCR